jgi:hypothetical protein
MPTRLSGKKADKPPVLIQHGIFFVSFINANSYKNYNIVYAKTTCLIPVIYFRMVLYGY